MSSTRLKHGEKRFRRIRPPKLERYKRQAEIAGFAGNNELEERFAMKALDICLRKKDFDGAAEVVVRFSLPVDLPGTDVDWWLKSLGRALERDPEILESAGRETAYGWRREVCSPRSFLPPVHEEPPFVREAQRSRRN